MENLAAGLSESEEEETTWFTFFSEREGRQYYYEPISGQTSWEVPSNGIISSLPGSPDVPSSSFYKRTVLPCITNPIVAILMFVLNLVLLTNVIQHGVTEMDNLDPNFWKDNVVYEYLFNDLPKAWKESVVYEYLFTELPATISPVLSPLFEAPVAETPVVDVTKDAPPGNVEETPEQAGAESFERRKKKRQESESSEVHDDIAPDMGKDESLSTEASSESREFLEDDSEPETSKEPVSEYAARDDTKMEVEAETTVDDSVAEDEVSADEIDDVEEHKPPVAVYSLEGQESDVLIGRETDEEPASFEDVLDQVRETYQVDEALIENEEPEISGTVSVVEDRDVDDGEFQTEETVDTSDVGGDVVEDQSIREVQSESPDRQTKEETKDAPLKDERGEPDYESDHMDEAVNETQESKGPELQSDKEVLDEELVEEKKSEEPQLEDETILEEEDEVHVSPEQDQADQNLHFDEETHQFDEDQAVNGNFENAEEQHEEAESVVSIGVKGGTPDGSYSDKKEQEASMSSMPSDGLSDETRDQVGDIAESIAIPRVLEIEVIEEMISLARDESNSVMNKLKEQAALAGLVIDLEVPTNWTAPTVLESVECKFGDAPAEQCQRHTKVSSS